MFIILRQHCIENVSDIKFDCLGKWKGLDGQTYLALEDSRKKPLFRCAVCITVPLTISNNYANCLQLYLKNPFTGDINIALSKDSTCDDVDLRSATQGYETLVMESKDVYQWPAEVENSRCR